MELELDESSLEVLKNAFAWVDFDGDGMVSREDLHMSSGLEREHEVGALFQALKEAGGSEDSNDYVTFEEFSKGIMDFPFLLEQFKSEYEGNSSRGLSIEIPEEPDIGHHVRNLSTFKTQETTKSGTAYLFSGLEQVLSILSRGIESSRQSSPRVSRESFSREYSTITELMNEVMLCLRTMQSCAADNYSKISVKGAIQLLSLLKDSYLTIEETAKDYKARLQDSQVAFDSLKQHNSYIEQTNSKLLKQINELETQTMTAQSQVIQENIQLQNKIRQMENSEEIVSSQMHNIQNSIKAKEDLISKLEKEIRRLTSYKTIQEMRGTNGRTADDMKRRKLEKKNSRLSVPISANSPVTSPTNKTQQRTSFMVEALNKQLKKKEETINQLEKKLTSSNLEQSKLRKKNSQLKERNKELNYQLQEERLKDPRLDTEIDEQGTYASLYDELQKIGGTISPEAIRSRSGTLEKKKEVRTTGTQASIRKNDRSCCELI